MILPRRTRQILIPLACVLLLRAASVQAEATQAPRAQEAATPVPVDRPTPAPIASAPIDPHAAARAEAEVRRQRALRLYDAGNYSAARVEFQRANELLPSFRFLYNLGVVSMALNDSAAAYDYFQRYLDQGGSAVTADLRAEILLQLQDLAGHIETLEVQVDTVGAQVFVDESPVGFAPLPKSLHVNSGPRKITARAESGRSQSIILELPGGETRSIELRLAPAPRRLEPPKKPVPWLGWAGSALLTAGATIAGIEALTAQREYGDALRTVNTPRSELTRLDTKTTTWSLTADTLGVAALAVGIYSLYITLHQPKERRVAAVSHWLAAGSIGRPARFVVQF